MPPDARWPHLKVQARQSTIDQFIDDAMAGIERDNPALKGVLLDDYARPGLDKQQLGQLIDMISKIMVDRIGAVPRQSNGGQLRLALPSGIRLGSIPLSQLTPANCV